MSKFKELAEEEIDHLADTGLEMEECVNCGGGMTEEDGIEYCPSCDMHVDYFGDRDEY